MVHTCPCVGLSISRQPHLWRMTKVTYLIQPGGERVHAGDLLVVFDLDKIKKAGYKATTMVLVSNAADMGVMTEPAIGKVYVLDKLYSFYD